MPDSKNKGSQPKPKAVPKGDEPECKMCESPRFNSVTFRVIWSASRNRYQVRGDDGRVHASSTDREAAIAAAVRKAKRAACLGMSGLVCVEQKDGSFKIEWSS